MMDVSSIPALNRFRKFCKKQKKVKCFKTKVSNNQIVISISNFDEFFFGKTVLLTFGMCSFSAKIAFTWEFFPE
jgi:hypothetical protein